jgi:hypothetical protein
MIVHSGVSLQVHLAEDLWQSEEAFGKQEEQHFAAFSGSCEIGERSLGSLNELGDGGSAVEL